MTQFPIKQMLDSQVLLAYVTSMVIERWLAPLKLTESQIKILFDREGLDPTLEEVASNWKTKDHRHPFSEVRVVVSGELSFSIAGNSFLLRPGDRIEVPANTRHWHANNTNETCVCICAYRPF